MLASRKQSYSSSISTPGPPTSTAYDTTRNPFDTMSDYESDSGRGSDREKKQVEKKMENEAMGEEEKTQFRTYQQQEKYENALKQQKREAGLQSNRSRSASRRARRQRIQKALEEGKYMKTTSLEALEEADANGELDAMQMFERIGPDSTSMDGPVTKARALRGEIPMRGTDPNQPYMMPYKPMGKSSLDDTDGLKLKVEANLDVEIELKASIRGDLTLSLFA